MPTKKKPAAPAAPEYPKTFETFRRMRDHDIGWMFGGFDKPSVFNGDVSVRKFKVTVEEVEEPKDVLEARLRKLWRESDNHHHWKPLTDEATRLGIKLNHAELGADVKRTKR